MTLGRRFYRIQPAQGFSAETAAAALLAASSFAGIPMSSAHVMSASVVGAGLALRPRGIRWSLVGDIALAWLITIPSAGIVSYFIARSLETFSHVVS